MKKLKIYLDTSVISHLQHDDAPDKMADTLRLWEQIKAGKYDVFISDVAMAEILRCPEPKRTILGEYLNDIKFDLVETNSNVNEIAQKFVDNNILSDKNLNDCRHIAAAIAYECDIIVSWNFKHIVNYRTIKGAKIVALMAGYDEIEIYSPTILIEGGEN